MTRAARRTGGRGPNPAAGAPAVLVGRSVVLRPLEPDDLALLATWWAEPEANVLDGGDSDGPSVQFREGLKNRVLKGRERNWFMVLGNGRPVGYVLYRTYSSEPGSAEVALRLTQGCWGRGFGSEAFRLFVGHLFERMGFARVWLTVYAFNPRAIRLYEKAGFSDEEAFVDEKGLDMMKMGLTADEFRRSRGVTAAGELAKDNDD